MSSLFAVLGILHWLGVAAIVVGYLLSTLKGGVSPFLLWGARAQLLIGLAMVAVAAMLGMTLNHVWVAAKLLVAVGVVACVESARARANRGDTRPTLVQIGGGLAFVNVALGLLWG